MLFPIHFRGKIIPRLDEAQGLSLDLTLDVDVTYSLDSTGSITLPFMRGTVDVLCAYRLDEVEPEVPVYRLVVVTPAGAPITELPTANLGVVPWTVAGQEPLFKFSVPSHDDGVEWLQEMRYEVQVWRNKRLCYWGVILKSVNNGKKVEVQCTGVPFYLSRRHVGRVPKRNLLHSPAPGEPASAVIGWVPKALPRSGFGGAGPARTTSNESYNDKPSKKLSSSKGKITKTYSNDNWFNGTDLTGDGMRDITDVLDKLTDFSERPSLSVAVYDDNTLNKKASVARAQARAEAVADFVLESHDQSKIDVAAYGSNKPLNDNDSAPKKTANRRTTITYRSVKGQKGHKQHDSQTITLRNPKSSERKQTVTLSAYVLVENAAGWAAEMKCLELVRSDPKRKHRDKKWAEKGYKKPLQTSVAALGPGTPMDVWIRLECTVVLPNNGKKSVIESRIFPPNGDMLVSEVWLTKSEALTYRAVEQTDIIEGLIAHAQDPKMGKSDLNITTNIQPTGQKRTRDYPFDERAPILDLLNEFPTLGNGVEWSMVYTPTDRIFTTHFPRKGSEKPVFLVAGGNATSYAVASDGSMISTTVIIQAPTGEGHSREERVASDPSLMDGIVLEKVYTATPNSPASSWRKQAERGLARYRRPVVIPQVTISPEATGDLLERVQVGDVVWTDISDESANVDTIRKVRVTEMALDPNSDTLTYTLVPEDIAVAVLSDFGTDVRYLSQAQNPIVGADGNRPVQSDVAFAARSFDDSAWSVGLGGVGWVKEATGDLIKNPAFVPKTIVTNTHEVWIRKHVACTGDMVVTLRAADWAYLYVNGHLVRNTHFAGYNRFAKAVYVNLRIPQVWLHESGDQVVAVHAQFDPRIRSSDEMDSVYADVSVRGTYHPEE